MEFDTLLPGSFVRNPHSLAANGVRGRPLRLRYPVLDAEPSEPFTRNGRQQTARFSKRKLEEVSQTSRANDITSSTNKKYTYGSNKDVYNPYNPFSSKEFIDQEIAAGRAESVPTKNQPPSAPQDLQRPSQTRAKLCHDSQGQAISHEDSQLPQDARYSSRRSGTVTNPRQVAAEFQSTSDDMSRPFEDSTLPMVPLQSQPGSPISEDFYGSPEDEKLDYEHELDLLFPDIGDTSAPSELISSFNELFASWSHRRRSQRSAEAERRRQLNGPETSFSRNYTASRGTGSSLPYANLAGRPWGSKRKRTVEQSESLDPSLQVQQPLNHHSPRPLLSVRGSGNQVSRAGGHSTPYIEDGADVDCAEDHFTGVAQRLPQSIRLKSGQHKAIHNNSSNSATSSSPSSPLSYQQQLQDMHSVSATTGERTMSPLLPLTSLHGTKYLVYTSELIPHSFTPTKRRKILDVFREKAPYVPACIMASTTGRETVEYYIGRVADAFVHRNAQRLFSGNGWPKNSLPVEVFENIASNLGNDHLKAMRLVNHEFEKYISVVLFRRVSVPFTYGIYGMVAQDNKTTNSHDVDAKGKQKETSEGQELDEHDIHDGMKVFRAWGPHVKKFAMTFEVAEDQLINPPLKSKFESNSTWWGSYAWPTSEYSRFEYCAGLEMKADESRCMSSALSNLQGVEELGLCVDSGLGWISGCDISDRAQLFRQKHKIFGARDAEGDFQLAKRQEIWNEILQSLAYNDDDISNYVISCSIPQSGQSSIMSNRYGTFRVSLHVRENIGKERSKRPLVFEGKDQSKTTFAPIYPSDTYHPIVVTNKFHQAPVVPNQLTVAQKEWLLETEWAQRAFLSSYCMALTDNAQTFQNVQTLNIAKLSSNHLTALQRKDIWTALPNLNKLILYVAPDFRTVKKKNGFAVTTDVRPSLAIRPFFKLLQSYVASVQSIKTLEIGYVGGGEHQTGLHGRNRHVMPCPLADYTVQGAFMQDYKGVLTLPYVEDLTLANCWIAPPTLKKLVKITTNLHSLTLNSISLTAHTGVTNPIGYTKYRLPIHAGSGTPRRDPANIPANFFTHRPNGSDPISIPGQDLDFWVHLKMRTGSWPDVIDSISPGPTLDLVRYAFQYQEEVPKLRSVGALKVIVFKSCGYVKVGLMSGLDQECLPPIRNNVRDCLQDRYSKLEAVAMDYKYDTLSGQIVVLFDNIDKNALTTGFPMQLGWDYDDDRKFDNLEDGQPLGGRGRFSGRVEKF